MKTIIAENYQKQKILHDLAKDNKGCLEGIEVESLAALLKEDRLDTNSVLLTMSKLLHQNKNDFPVYAGMFSYPAFLKEILDFALECRKYHISADQLPQDNANEEELKRILALVLSLDLIGYEPDLSIFENGEYEIYPSFYPDAYHYRILQKIRKSCTVLKRAEVHPAKELHYALNTSQEIESIAQDICHRKKSCNIILTSYSEQFPILSQVFQRYGIPFSALKEETPLHIPHVFASLAKLAWKKDKPSLLEALKADAFPFTCSYSLIAYLSQAMPDLSYDFSLGKTMETSPFADQAASLIRNDESAEAYFHLIQEDLDALLEAESPQNIFKTAYGVMKKSPYLQQKEELRAALSIRSLLQTNLDKLEENEIGFLIELADQNEVEKSPSYTNDFCCVSDLTHPLSLRKVSYVLNCSGRTYPAFPAKRGLFDEAYVKKIPAYPSMQERHDAYMEQLRWIADSGEETIFYSWGTNDYEGREIQLAFDIESMFAANSAVKWPLDSLYPYKEAEHKLSETTAKQLFFGRKLNVSISTVERWFACPYSYFLQAGLKVRENRTPERDASTIGSASHAVLDQSIKKYGKKYAQISKEEISSILDPYFDALYASHPEEKTSFEITRERMIESLQLSLSFLADMETTTSFVPTDTEMHFDKEIVPGITLHGIIDRIDTCHEMIRVLDYKSSEHSLSEKKIKAGLQLQLLSYLVILAKQSRKTPAGAYYFCLKEDSFSIPALKPDKKEIQEAVLDEETFRNEFRRTRRLKGWTFADRQTELDENGDHIVSLNSLYDWDAVEQCISELYEYFRKHLEAGDISLSPDENACLFCPYRSICRFHKEVRKDVPLVMKDIPLKASKKEEG